jgi:hypothetical protein
MDKVKKNRFYYSRKQAYLFGEPDYNFVKVNGVWEKYSEWCSLPDSKSNWDDAILVYESDDNPEIKIGPRSSMRFIADL